ncbi:hypothetical protein, partial [Citrobacter freundii]
SDTLVPTTYLVDTTLSYASDYDQTALAGRLRLFQVKGYNFNVSTQRQPDGDARQPELPGVIISSDQESAGRF